MINNMKKLMIMGILLAIAGSMRADNFKIADFEIKAGEEKTIEVELINENEYTGFEFNISLPTGLTVSSYYDPDEEETVYEAALVSDRVKSKHSLTVGLVSGKYKFLCYSSTNQTLKGNSGAIVTFKVKAASDLAAGALTGTITGQVLSPVSGTDVKPADVTFNVTATTGINEVELSNDKPATIYDLKGNTVRKNATSTEGLSKGVYIIDSKKVIVK